MGALRATPDSLQQNLIGEGYTSHSQIVSHHLKKIIRCFKVANRSQKVQISFRIKFIYLYCNIFHHQVKIFRF